MIEPGSALTAELVVDEAWSRARRILAIRLDNLGDVLVTTPAMHAIKESIPGVELSLLASPVGAQVGRLNPDIDEVIVHQAPWMDPWCELPHDSEREQRLIAAIRERCFDGAVIFGSYHQSPLPAAYLCYLAGVPLRLAASIDGPGSLLTTRHKHPNVMMHEVERGLDLVAAVGMSTADTKLALAVPGSAREEARAALANNSSEFDATTASGSVGLGATIRATAFQTNRRDRDEDNGFSHGMKHPLVVVHPGCSMPARTYPWEMYAEIVALLVARLGATVVLTGTEGERELVERVMTRAQAFLAGDQARSIVSLAGGLSFPGLCGLIEQADLTITNNTGPMHISAALQTPVIALFALTNPPEQWGPWRVPHRLLYHDVPCRICYSRICPYEHECLRLVSPERVVEAAAELLSETSAGSSQLEQAAGTGAARHPSFRAESQWDGVEGSAVPWLSDRVAVGRLIPRLRMAAPSSARDDGGMRMAAPSSARDDGSNRAAAPSSARDNGAEGVISPPGIRDDEAERVVAPSEVRDDGSCQLPGEERAR